MATNYPGSLDSGTQQPSPSSSTEMDDSGFEHDVVHTNHSGAIIALETKVGTGDSNAVADSVLAGTGSGTSAWTTGTLANDISGNAATAAALETARTINGTSFNGTANITVTAAADTLTGTELKSTVVTSSLTSVGTLTGLTVNGVVDVDGGSAAAPSLTFTGDTNTGIFQQAADAVGITTGGTERVRIGSFGIRGDDSGDVYNFDAFKGNDGSASAPTFSFDGDTNTGMYRVGGDRLGFTTGGSARMYIQNSSTGLTGSGSRSLSVKASGAIEMYRTASGASDGILALYSDNGSTGDLQWLVYGDGDTASDTGSYGSISDNRLKTNIAAYKDPTGDLMAINVIKYDLSKTSTGVDDNGDPIIVDRDESKTMTGWDAQQVQSVKPGFVKLDAERGIYSVKSSVFVPLLHRGFQVHEDKLTALEARIAALEAA